MEEECAVIFATLLSVVVGLAAVGCSSSDDSSSGASGSGGVAGTSGGATNHGGSSGSAGSNNAGTSNAGTGGASAGSGGTGAGQAGSAAVTPGGSGGTGSAGAPDETAGAAGEGTTTPQACNTVDNAASALTAVTIQQSAGTVPTLAQGTIQSGTYYLSAVTLYNGGTTAVGTVSATAQVSVNDHTVTINSVDSLGQLNTIVIVMGTPTSALPVSITVECSSDISFQADVGNDVKTTTSYGVTGDTLIVYTSGTKLFRTFTLHA